MQRKLTIAVLVTVVVTLLLAGISSVLLIRREDRQATQRALEQEASALASLMQTIPFRGEQRNPQLLRAVEILRRNDVTALLLTDDKIVGQLPEQVEPGDLIPLHNQFKQSVSGIRDGTAWAAAVGVRPGPVTTVLVLTDDADQLLGVMWRWLVVSAAVSLAIGAVVAAWFSRRLTGPIARARDATRKIAGGDLSARVNTQHRGTDEIGELSESINTMAESLERSRALERQFLMSVSHDLRTPLTSIRGYSEAISDGTAENSQEAAEVIVAESARLERLVSDLLDLARLEAREFSLHMQWVDVGSVVSDVCAGFALAAEEAGIALEVVQDDSPEGAAESTVAWCDAGRLAQIAANLVQNALKFAETSVRVGYRTSQGQALVTVADDGVGISQEDLPHVFERLYAARHSPKVEEAGSGLGLAIVAELAHAMGGEVSVAAQEPSGTGFTVVLRSSEED